MQPGHQSEPVKSIKTTFFSALACDRAAGKSVSQLVGPACDASASEETFGCGPGKKTNARTHNTANAANPMPIILLFITPCEKVAQVGRIASYNRAIYARTVSARLAASTFSLQT